YLTRCLFKKASIKHMERFTDQPLGPRPHIAVFGSDKVGNFVLTTPLLRGLKEKYPDATLDFFGGATTRDLETACPNIDARFSLYGEREDYLSALNAFVAERRAHAGDYDLAINCDEFSELNLVVVAAVAPRYLVGASLQPDFFRIEVTSSPPSFAVPDVLLHMTTTRSAKQWLPEYWRILIDWCGARGLSVGVLGSKPQIERERYHAGDWEEQMIAEL